MVITRKKYAIVDLINVASTVTGEIVSEYPLAEALKADGVENGMFLHPNHVAQEVQLVAGGSQDEGKELYINWTEEVFYTGQEPRNQFKAMDYPRLFKLVNGDAFETNAVNGELAAGGYATIKDGFIVAGEEGVDAATASLLCQEEVVLNNGEQGYRFIVINEKL